MFFAISLISFSVLCPVDSLNVLVSFLFAEKLWNYF